MADEKKPKIDLKARLGKTSAGGATPPPSATGAIPVPGPLSSPALGSAPAGIPIPAPSHAAAGVPVPPGIPVGPPPGFGSAPGLALDPSNPLAAAVAPPSSARSVAPPPQPQRIEVDEVALQEARKGARKQGVVVGLVVAVVLGAIGYIAGGAQETNKVRAQSVSHAKSLADDVQKSRDQLKALADKLEAGKNTLSKDKKFPETLARDLGGINVDFDGSKLAGVRFSGFSMETTSGLIEYISAVQATNDRKSALVGLLSRLQKPMTEMLEAQSSGKPPPVSFVVLVNRDAQRNPFAVLAPLQKPIEEAAMPAEFTAIDPFARSTVTAPKLTTLDKPGAIPVVPKSMEAAFPSDTTGQVAQLASQLTRLISDVNGEAATEGEAITEPKPGLLERADRLVTNLNKVK